MRDVASDALDQIVGNSPVVQHIRWLIKEVAPHPLNVIIVGETGTGKELIARALAACARVRLHVANCAGLSESLLESELFGHEKGAFTGAVKDRKGLIATAANEILFLDELAELPLTTQVKVLRVVEYGDFRRLGSDLEYKVNVRIVAATNVDVDEAVASGRFRRDLFHRLEGVPIRVPPLRERREDIPLIASALLSALPGMHETSTRLSDCAKQILSEMDWPGNVRQLLNVIRRLPIVARGFDTIDAVHIDKALRLGSLPSSESRRLTLDEVLDKATRTRLVQALNDGGTRAQMAQSIGKSEATFYRLLESYGLGNGRH